MGLIHIEHPCEQLSNYEAACPIINHRGVLEGLCGKRCHFNELQNVISI